MEEDPLVSRAELTGMFFLIGDIAADVRGIAMLEERVKVDERIAAEKALRVAKKS